MKDFLLLLFTYLVIAGSKLTLRADAVEESVCLNLPFTGCGMVTLSSHLPGGISNSISTKEYSEE